MICNVMLDNEGRITASSEKFSCGPDEIQFDFPYNFYFNDQFNYKIIGEELIHDPVSEPDPAPSGETETGAILDALLGVE